MNSAIKDTRLNWAEDQARVSGEEFERSLDHLAGAIKGTRRQVVGSVQGTLTELGNEASRIVDRLGAQISAFDQRPLRAWAVAALVGALAGFALGRRGWGPEQP